MAFQDQVTHPGGAQVLAHRQAGLATPDDENLNLFGRHAYLHSSCFVRCASVFLMQEAARGPVNPARGSSP
ncbi:hypothetical protein Acsp01_85140 [Actinoplanes sp. NBRC 101535]|nr:hypothetical protein Acsp01_85140 [Actinoplanes sp. NBRC 101535]